ncbi:MAG: hypothetical protein ACOC1G_05700 [Phycisphaeraceae bacterium]
MQLQPFIVLLASWFLFAETLTWPQVAAGTVLAAGAYVLLRVRTDRT